MKKFCIQHYRLTTTRIIMLGFLLGALIGAFLLTLPVSLRPGAGISFIDAPFGQVVLLFLIQFGGLGIVTFTTIVLCIFRRRITLSDRMLIQSAYNLDTLTGLVRLTMRILKVTLFLEGLGALGYFLVFIPQYGATGI